MTLIKGNEHLYSHYFLHQSNRLEAKKVKIRHFFKNLKIPEKIVFKLSNYEFSKLKPKTILLKNLQFFYQIYCNLSFIQTAMTDTFQHE